MEQSTITWIRETVESVKVSIIQRYEEGTMIKKDQLTLTEMLANIQNIMNEESRENADIMELKQELGNLQDSLTGPLKDNIADVKTAVIAVENKLDATEKNIHIANAFQLDVQSIMPLMEQLKQKQDEVRQSLQQALELDMKLHGEVSNVTKQALEAFHFKITDKQVVPVMEINTEAASEIQQQSNESKETNTLDYKEIVEAHARTLKAITKKNEHTPIVINAFGGPGAGKSTASLGIAKELKKMGYVAEYVPEYSKELVWDENWNLLDGTADHQLIILEEQIKRIDRLIGKVDFVVTDAPILLNQIYNKELTPEYAEMLEKLYRQYENFNFVVERDPKEFETEGRMHNLQESQQKDQEVNAMLDKYGLYYGTYNHASVERVITNAVKTYNRVNKIPEHHIEPYRAVLYGKENRQIFYGNNPEELLHMLQEKQNANQELVSSKVYIGRLQQEGRYGENVCYDIKSGEDISPIYLQIPHISDRSEFRELVSQLKEQGAKYNSHNSKWYITKQMDPLPFSRFLPDMNMNIGKEKSSVLSKLEQNKEAAEEAFSRDNAKEPRKEKQQELQR